DRVLRRHPGRAAQVDHDVDRVADGAADGVDLLDDPRDAAGLDRGDAALLEAERHLRRVGVAGDPDAVPHLAAEEGPDRRSQDLALDVPERHVDAAHRAGADDAGHAVAHDGAEHLLPEPLDVARILADEEGREILDRALDDARPAAALADAGDALI